MCFGHREQPDRTYRGHWRSGDTRIVKVRQSPAKSRMTCAEVEAVGSGDTVVVLRLEGGLMDWSNEVRVE